ncbi:class I SAM-dependent methyltransferase [Kosakonia radicincitans]|uniref:class I SAM-dependent methyltransferase n=1 Tax=Kosakonia radicincitans TaxID=283686 RepID=UPI001D097DDB|nr:class I SAM-dependent methyltransferase [Kosakonia radicincitans]
MKNISELVRSELAFFPELGIGHYPVPESRPYDGDYFEKYQKMAETDMGRKLTQARVDFVRRHFAGPVTDVGIGCGQFVEAINGQGYDVNPRGIEWLINRGAYHDIYAHKASALTFWDVLEHIDDPVRAISQATEWVFVSVPIFSNAEHILCSRHFRKDEHIWYWTHEGIIRWFSSNGFICKEHNTIESELGRDGIGTYAFMRTN